MARIYVPKRCKALFLSLLFVAFCCSTAPAAEKRVLSLDQLIQMALEYSPELKMADQEVLAAKGDLRQAKAGSLPQLELTGVIGPAEKANEPIVLFDRFVDGRRVGRLVDQDREAVTFFGRLDFTITQPLYTFGKISNRQDAAALGVEAQIAGRDKKRNEVILNIKELYYAYLIAGQGKAAAKEADDFIGDASRRIRRLIEMNAKNADTTDIYRLDAFSAEVKAFASKAESGAHLSYQALKKAVGLRDDEDFRLDATELPRKPRTLGSESDYIYQAKENRPELVQVKKGTEARKKMMDAAKADLYPSFFAAAIGSTAGSPGRETLDISYFSDEFNHAYAGVVAGAQWNFDFGIGKGKLDRARAEYLKTRYQQDYAEQNIPLEVMKYYQDALEAQASWTAYEQAAKGSRRWIVAAFSNFDVGVGSARDMFDAIDRYGKNQGEYLRALYNYHISLARLDYAIGSQGAAR